MMNPEDGKMNAYVQQINLIQSLNISKLDDSHISFIEEFILKDLNSTRIQDIHHLILPLALSWAEYDSPVKLKLLSCRILGETISNTTDSLILQRHVLPITQFLLQDTDSHVRSSVWRHLPSLLGKLDQHSENQLLTYLLDAAHDDSTEVRCAVLDVLVESKPLIHKVFIKEFVVSTLKKLVESSLLPNQDEFLLHVSKLYSRLCNTYKDHLDLEDRDWFVSHFASLCQRDNETSATYLSSSLVPMMLFAEPSPALCHILVSCVRTLSNSVYASVRQILCSTLFQIVKACEIKSRKNLLDVLVLLLQEKLEVFNSLIPHLFSIISTLLDSNETEDYSSLISSLRACEDTVSQSFKWRLYVLYMQEIQRLVGILPAHCLLEHFQEALFYRIKHSRPIPSRLAASKTLLTLLTKINSDSLTSKCISRIHKDLYCSRSFYDRNLFVKICHQTIQMLSFEDFKKYFLPSLILLSADPVANIRFSVTSLLVHSSVRLMSFPDAELSSRIEQCLAELKSDPDVDVSANVNSLGSKLKEKRASALLNLLIEPALVLQEDLVEHRPSHHVLDSSFGHQDPSDRPVMIHPYMKASMEKEFLIDAGIPLNSTPMSENYRPVMNKTEHTIKTSYLNCNNRIYEGKGNLSTSINKPVSINLRSARSEETPFSHGKIKIGDPEFINGTDSLAGRKYDRNGNIASHALHDNQRTKSKLGIPKKFIHHERFPSNQLVDNDENVKYKVNSLVKGTNETSYNDKHVNSNPLLPIRTNKPGIKFNSPKPSGNSLLFSKQTENSHGNDINYFEHTPKNANELIVHPSSTLQRNNQNESSSNLLRYQMFKPKNNVKDSEPVRPEINNNAKSNSPGSKLKRAFLSTLGRNQRVKQNTLSTFKKDVPSNERHETIKLFPVNSTGNIRESTEIMKVGSEQRKNESNLTLSPEHRTRISEDESNISESKVLPKQTSLMQPNFQRNFFSPKEHKRKSVHVMESCSGQKKDSDNRVHPPHERSARIEHEIAPNEVNPNTNLGEIDKQNLLPTFQSKRKSMYQPSDRDSLLTTFFKGHTLKYQPKVMNERKNSVPCLNEDQSDSPFSEPKIGSTNNTLPRPQKTSYRSQSSFSNLRTNEIPELPDRYYEYEKTPEIYTGQSFSPSHSPDHDVYLLMHSLTEISSANSSPDLRNTDNSMSSQQENLKNDELIKNYSEPLDLKTEQENPYGATRQSKINHLDLQNNEFLFYKNKNCSDVEISHVDSPRNSFVNSSDQDDAPTRVGANTENITLTNSNLNIAVLENTSHPNFQDHLKVQCNDLLPRISAKNDIVNNQTRDCKIYSDNDITQKILNLTNEVETIDHYLNSDSTSTDNPRHCISPVKQDVIKSPNTPQFEENNSRKLNNVINDSPQPAPPGIMKRSPNIDKKKVMFLNDKVVTPEECQRLSLNFEKELNELNSKIEKINEEIRIETLNLEQAKSKNEINEIQSQNFNTCKSTPAYPVNKTENGHIVSPLSHLNHQIPSNPNCHKNTDMAVIREIADAHVDESSTEPVLSKISEDQVLEASGNDSEFKPPSMSPKTHIAKEKKSDDIDLTSPVETYTDRGEPTVKAEQDTVSSDSRVFRESKLMKRHAHRRSYDERISKLDFHGFNKKSDTPDGNTFNKHSTYRRSFDDKSSPPASTSNESLVTNLPPKVPSANTSGTASIVNSSGLKKVSNYQIFSDRRKNILENKSFTVRIGSRNPQQNSDNHRDISPSVSCLSNNSSTYSCSLSQQENIETDSDSKFINQSTSDIQHNTADKRNDQKTITTESHHKEVTCIGKSSQIIGKPRVSVSPLKYSSASLKKSIPSAYAEVKSKPADQTSLTQPSRHGRPDVTVRNRSPSPQLVDDSHKQVGKTSSKIQYAEVPWRRQTSKMQAPRSISQIIESQIPGLNEDNSHSPAPPIPAREKSIPDISDQQVRASIKSRFVSKSPSPSKIIQPRYESGAEINQQSSQVKKQVTPPTRIERFDHTNADSKTMKIKVTPENPSIDIKKTPPSPNFTAKLANESVTKVVKVGPSPLFGYNRTDGQSDSTSKSGVTTVVMVRRSPSSTSDSVTRYHKSQGNLSKNSSESLTNRSEQSSEASEVSSRIPGKKNLKGSKFSCLRAEQDSFYKNCHMSTEDRPRSCIIPNGIHVADKSNASLKSISEENLQHSNRRASSAGAIPTIGGGSKLPRRSIKF